MFDHSGRLNVKVFVAVTVPAKLQTPPDGEALPLRLASIC
jgi:hypothetical protein